ncbi:MAG: glycosyltransferase family 4 protein [Candidatus Absconditabacteria bacterium]|nr:glycosyltransferase family 4 protein [Candidatus Absconditabacteria bacterium]MDD4714379.1 glycosyltransferase family 4 protein [Candidatus Absconditabacteria bacterium]
MRLIQFLPYFPPHSGGLEQVAQHISSSFVEGKYGEVVNLTFSVGQQKEEGSYMQDGYKVIILPAFDLIYSFPFPKFWRKSFWKGIKEAKQFGADIIQTHTRFFLSSFLGGLLAKLWKKKWVHIEHGGGFVEDISGWKRAIAWCYDQTLGRLVFASADRVVSINKANIPFISKFTKASKISVIYNGISFPSTLLKKKKRKKAELGFVGRLAPGKGVHILLEAIKAIVKSGETDFHLSLIGDGTERDSLESFVKDHQFSCYVTFLGKKPRDEVVSFLSEEVDILVNPSFREGLPTTVLEGLLAQCVVIATDVGGTREISRKDDLILVQPKSAEQLREAITPLLNNCSNLQGLSFQGIKENFSWEKNVSEYFKIYQNLLKK